MATVSSGRVHGELGALFDGVEELVETKPFGDELIEGDFGAGVGEEAAGLLFDGLGGCLEFALGRGAEEFGDRAWCSSRA
jgi:hypothetical protein